MRTEQRVSHSVRIVRRSRSFWSASVDEAKKAFADFPLVKAGLIEIDAIPLGPFLNWEMLFAAPRP
jgi:hypothetical protein